MIRKRKKSIIEENNENEIKKYDDEAKRQEKRNINE